MKLLFDQNVSPDLVHDLADLFPGSDHVYNLNLDRVGDRVVRALLAEDSTRGILILYAKRA